MAPSAQFLPRPVLYQAERTEFGDRDRLGGGVASGRTRLNSGTIQETEHEWPDERNDTSSPPPPFAQCGHAHDGAAQILFGRQREEIDACPTDACVQTLRALPGRFGKATPKRSIAGIDIEMLACLGILDHDQTRVGQFDLARIPQPDGDQFVASIEQRRATAPTPVR